MSIYIIIWLLFVFFAMIESSLDNNVKKHIFITSGVILAFIAGFRTCGVDFFLYQNIVNNRQLYTLGPLKYNMENGAGLIYLYLGYFFHNYNVLVASVSAITVYCFYFVIKKVCCRPSFGVLFMFVLYFFMSIMMQSRQSCALSIVLIAILYVKQKNILSLALIVIAMGFHQTALIALLIFLVPDKMFALKYYVIIYIACVFYREIFDEFIPNLNLLEISYINNKYSAYENRQEGLDQSVSIFSTIDVLYFLLFYIVYAINKQQKDENVSYWINLFFTSLCFRHIFYFLYELSIRGSQYFGVSQLLLIFALINYVYGQKKILNLSKIFLKYYLVSYLIILTYFTFGRTIKENINIELIPYTNYFF